MSFFTDPPLHDFPDRAIRLLQKYPAHLQEVVAAAAPDLAPGFDFSGTVSLRREFPLPDWRQREGDLLFHVPFREPAVAKAALVCILLEHQSAPDPRMPLRTLLYAVLYWEREWREWEKEHPRGEGLRLSPVLPIVLHTGHERWASNLTFADLIAGPDAFRPFAPVWRPLFWNLEDRTPEELLAGGEWLQTLAVVRGEREEPERFWSIFAEVAHRLEPLSGRDKMRWQDLMWFMLSWGLKRRPASEQDHLLAIAQSSITNVAVRKEIEAMGKVLGPTWDDTVMARGEMRATRRNLKRFLEGRFGPLPEALAARIEATDNLEQLDRCIEQAAHITRLDELQL